MKKVTGHRTHEGPIEKELGKDKSTGTRFSSLKRRK